MSLSKVHGINLISQSISVEVFSRNVLSLLVWQSQWKLLRSPLLHNNIELPTQSYKIKLQQTLHIHQNWSLYTKKNIPYEISINYY